VEAPAGSDLVTARVGALLFGAAQKIAAKSGAMQTRDRIELAASHFCVAGELYKRVAGEVWTLLHRKNGAMMPTRTGGFAMAMHCCPKGTMRYLPGMRCHQSRFRYT
jgi:hypothetical protein